MPLLTRKGVEFLFYLLFTGSLLMSRSYPFFGNIYSLSKITQAKKNGVRNIDFHLISLQAVGGQLIEEDGELVVVGRKVPLFQVPADEALFIRRPTKANVREYIREYTGQLIILLATEQAELICR
jgi:hypothetical protein